MLLETPDRGAVVTAKVLQLSLFPQVRRAERLEAHEEAAEARFDGALEQTRPQHGGDRARRLPDPVHALHAVEQRSREPRVPEEVVVEEVEVTARQARDLRESVFNRLV